jgi:hypothetical protein
MPALTWVPIVPVEEVIAELTAAAMALTNVLGSRLVASGTCASISVFIMSSEGWENAPVDAAVAEAALVKAVLMPGNQGDAILSASRTFSVCQLRGISMCDALILKEHTNAGWKLIGPPDGHLICAVALLIT